MKISEEVEDKPCSSYQVLMEGQCEVIAKNEKSGQSINLTEVKNKNNLSLYAICT